MQNIFRSFNKLNELNASFHKNEGVLYVTFTVRSPDNYSYKILRSSCNSSEFFFAKQVASFELIRLMSKKLAAIFCNEVFRTFEINNLIIKEKTKTNFQKSENFIMQNSKSEGILFEKTQLHCSNSQSETTSQIEDCPFIQSETLTLIDESVSMIDSPILKDINVSRTLSSSSHRKMTEFSEKQIKTLQKILKELNLCLTENWNSIVAFQTDLIFSKNSEKVIQNSFLNFSLEDIFFKLKVNCKLEQNFSDEFMIQEDCWFLLEKNTKLPIIKIFIDPFNFEKDEFIPQIILYFSFLIAIYDNLILKEMVSSNSIYSQNLSKITKKEAFFEITKIQPNKIEEKVNVVNFLFSDFIVCESYKKFNEKQGIKILEESFSLKFTENIPAEFKLLFLKTTKKIEKIFPIQFWNEFNQKLFLNFKPEKSLNLENTKTIITYKAIFQEKYLIEYNLKLNMKKPDPKLLDQALIGLFCSFFLKQSEKINVENLGVGKIPDDKVLNPEKQY